MLKRILVVLVIGLLSVGCGGSKKATRSTKRVKKTRTVVRTNSELDVEEAATPDDNLDNGVNPVPKGGVDGYIEQYATIAKEEMELYGIPASITLAQGILESGAGKGELVQKANNHFGIKCHDWKGQKVYHDDDTQGECFRKYSLPKFSYRDHSLFLTGRKRYTDLFKLPKDDYEGWAKGLRRAGYATDKKYPQKLISLIERYKLYTYDGEVLGKAVEDYDKVTDNNNQHTVRKGETLFRLAKKYKVTVDDLKKWNGIDGDNIFEGQVIYIKPFDRGY
ncbi:glucosaminidase domain-containing protein [uncultured Dokdonia sp.]|uniref:glucosaminidase domain-containing protein n=1 Tax=uncultured Dokdonia sp. TaxID=575653 RepID=UPI00261A8BE5|nr:glucosaminidase domain-containing protein [uncultured Dokdonia sp.]